MLRGLVCLLAMTPALALGGPNVPMNWSPDGRWIAYTVSTRAGRPVFSAGWIFENAAEAPPRKVSGPDDHRGERTPFRIYAADADTGSAILLYESRGRLTSPAWRPDGRALAFGRVVDEAPAAARFELIIQDAPGENRVIVSQAIGDKPAGDFDWTAPGPGLVFSTAVTWSSPDSKPPRGCASSTRRPAARSSRSRGRRRSGRWTGRSSHSSGRNERRSLLFDRRRPRAHRQGRPARSPGRS